MKWCIKITEENLPVVGKWFNENSIGINYHFPIIKEHFHICQTVYTGHTELTFEQFKEQILKEPKVLNDILDKILDKQYEYIDTLRKEVVNVQDIKNIFLEYGIKSEPKF